ncbi:MAG: carboxy terminal-processing peptidase [Gammaproteobacteria bacterium]|nr:carboxy terminal-processing peptidase [Gammaproteobacteria bacterium]
MQQRISRLYKFATTITMAIFVNFYGSYLSANDIFAPVLTSTSDQQEITQELLQFIKQYHYQTRTIDDQFGSDVFQQYLETIDPQRMYLSEADLAPYQHLNNDLDDQLNEGHLDTLVELFNLMQVRRLQAVTYFQGRLQDEQQSFDYAMQESLPIYADKHPRQPDLASLRDLWRQLLKNQFINGLIEQETDAQIRARLLKRYDSQIKRLLQVDQRDMFSTIANSITTVTDPHTTYLSPRNVEDFNIDMSLSLEGIGAVLQRDNDYTKIVRIVPGGPADKAGELKAADYIVGVAQEGQAMVDVIGQRLDDVVNLIRGPKGSRVSLQIIPGGDIKERPQTIHIVRNRVKLEDQAATQEIIQMETDIGLVKIGVIKLPTFYFDYEGYRRGDKDYRSTSKDVMKLVAELREAEVDGIIVDLRNNGGGALLEANQLTGLFIKQGPTVQVRYSNGAIEKQLDKNPLLVYAGPMAVLVNRISASASEIFAGAMQDYQRALIVGAQTYGKGTVQTLTDLSKGQIKYTQAKFYRVTGASTQHKGVIPDITLPTLIDHSRVGESNLDYALAWDQVATLEHPRYINLPQIVPYLQEQQDIRSEADPDLYYAKQVKAYRQDKVTSISLNINQRNEEWAAKEQWYLDAINELRTKHGQAPVDDVQDHDFNYEEANNDPYLQSTAQVLLDWLRLAQ